MLASTTSRLHARISTTAPTEANRVVQLLRAMLTRAQEWGLLPEGAVNPAQGVRLNQEKSRERWVMPEELPALVEAINQESNPYIASALRLFLLTGCRRNELLRLKWKDVDFTRMELRLTETKTDARTVPLTQPALVILRQLPRQLGNAYVFPGHVTGSPLVNINKAWRRVRARQWLILNPDRTAALRAQAVSDVHARSKHAERTGDAIEHQLLTLAAKEALGDNAIRLHDLRRTVGAWLATAGTSASIVGKVLGHASPTATAIYARIGETAARQALEEHGERIGPLLATG